MHEERLKLCPCCRAKASLESRTVRGHGGCDLYDWHVICCKCGLRTREYSDEAKRDIDGIRLIKDGAATAIYAWNRRAGKPEESEGEQAGGDP